ncbi:SprT-like domain-containing protein [Myxococcota bacterium]|nr:SprT-like domain-containing protein [Myxococcota bacterium]
MTLRDASQLRDELERALLVQLASLWRDINWIYFKDRMSPPALELSDAASFLGRWHAPTRTISIARHLAFEHPWAAVEEVLRHEMAHQFVDEVLGAHGETAHGTSFKLVCERLGIDPAASGLPATDALEGGAARVVEKIARLLSLAGSANQHEAEAAAIAARKLMLKHNLDVQSAPKRYGFKRLGEPAGRIEEAARICAGILGELFFVEVLWVPVYVPVTMKRGKVLEVMGTPENLAIAEYVHAFLGQAAERLWQQHKQVKRVGSDRDRRTYHAGVMAGFREKLLLDQQKTATSERALVWVKDPALEEFYRRRHPRVVMRTHGGRPRNASFHEGRSAGRKLVLAKPIVSQAVTRGRLLGPGKRS